MAEFAERIKALRKEHGLTQQGVGEIIGVKNMLSTPMKRVGLILI